jgi:AraC family transcriptional regulator of adaptative response / DNA-3-methyladenine glycosylase II
LPAGREGRVTQGKGLKHASERNEVERAARESGAPTALPAGREGRVTLSILSRHVRKRPASARATRYTSDVVLDPDSCYRALCARDARFDGVFYVGVKTTGVYCRPICPARTPKSTRCEFFARAVEAEGAGFRACFRCRPELAPGLSSVDALPRLVQIAVARIEAGYLNEHSIDDLASSLCVTSRHLRRAIAAELGVSALELAQMRRLALAKQLLDDGVLSITDVAFGAGFSSVRRFNALCRERLGKAPSDLRRVRMHGADNDCIALRLDYRPPFDWVALLAFLRARAIPGVESVDAHEYRRSVVIGEHSGWLAVSPDPKRHALRARVSLSLSNTLMAVVARLRALFDLDARPDIVTRHLGRDSRLRALLAAHPGLRVPGAFDGFEMAVRAILGQQVSVRAATTLSGRLVARFGSGLASAATGIDRAFPTPLALASATLADVRAVGMPTMRARSVIELACAVAAGGIDLSSTGDPEQVGQALQKIRGLGPWTAQYVAMRVSRWPDAFVAGDLAVQKAMRVTSARAAEQSARAWQPWRAYAVMHLWSSLATGG